MSLYNMLFGRNPYSELLLAMIELTPAHCGRFRDCYPSEDGTKIIVYTRNGGGNREEYQPVIDALAEHPNYLRDYDDDYDCTYASIEFSVPEAWAKHVKAIADQADTRPPAAKWEALLSDMQGGKDTAAVSRALEVGKQIFGAIASGESGTVSTPDGSVHVEQVNPQPVQKP